MTNFINQFQGWMSQDDQLFSKGQCVYSHWIDTTRTPWELKLMPTLSNVGAFTSSYSVCSIFPWATEWTIWYGTEWGIIKDRSNTTIANVGTVTPINDWILFLGYFYVFTPSIIYRYTPSGWILGSQTTFMSRTLGYYQHPVIYQGGEMYFPWTPTSNKNVSYVDSLGVRNTLFDTDFSTDIRWLSIQGSTLRIYSEYLLSVVDIGTKTVQYSQVLPFKVNGVKSDGNVDYVITDSDEMYLCSGLEFRKLCESTKSDILANYTTSSTKFTFKTAQSNTTISVANGRVYTIDRLAPRFLMYGRKSESLPNSFSYWPIQEEAVSDPIDNFTAIYSENNVIYLGYDRNGTYKIGEVRTTNTGNCYEWVYITHENDIGDFSMIKAIDEIRVGKEGITGELWASIDWATFELVGSLTQTDIQQKFTTYKKDFRKIAFMFKLYSATDKIINLDLRFTNRQV